MNINERVEIELTRHDLDLIRYQNGQIKALRWAQTEGSGNGSNQKARKP